MEREIKLRLIVHAEMNAILDAGKDADMTTLYLYGFRSAPCTNCTKHVIAAGIMEVISCGPEIPERWKKDLEHSNDMLKEAGIHLSYIREGDLII